MITQYHIKKRSGYHLEDSFRAVVTHHPLDNMVQVFQKTIMIILHDDYQYCIKGSTFEFLSWSAMTIFYNSNCVL